MRISSQVEPIRRQVEFDLRPGPKDTRGNSQHRAFCFAFNLRPPFLPLLRLHFFLRMQIRLLGCLLASTRAFLQTFQSPLLFTFLPSVVAVSRTIRTAPAWQSVDPLKRTAYLFVDRSAGSGKTKGIRKRGRERRWITDTPSSFLREEEGEALPRSSPPRFR